MIVNALASKIFQGHVHTAKLKRIGFRVPSRGFVELNIDSSFDEMISAIMQDVKGFLYSGCKIIFDHCPYEDKAVAHELVSGETRILHLAWYLFYSKGAVYLF